MEDGGLSFIGCKDSESPKMNSLYIFEYVRLFIEK